MKGWQGTMDWCRLQVLLFESLKSIHNSNDTEIATCTVGLVLLTASWTQLKDKGTSDTITSTPTHANAGTSIAMEQSLMDLVTRVTYGFDSIHTWGAHIIVDATEESLSQCLRESPSDAPLGVNSDTSHLIPCPPDELPALALVVTSHHELHSWEYLPISSWTLRQHLLQSSTSTLQIPHRPLISTNTETQQVNLILQQALEGHAGALDWAVLPEACSDALRIFVAGDRSSVGKSSVCLGIVSSLLQQQSSFSTTTSATQQNARYPASQLGYIKPATQSEAPQLIEQYSQVHGIRCVPIGPLVYYRGFTRAFLAGTTDETAVWLERCARAVDRVARGKRVVLVDGVGFPAVGSICGTDNARMAWACGYPVAPPTAKNTDTATEMDTSPVKSEITTSANNTDASPPSRRPMGVLLVGGPGVGSAVDAFHLNATYFAHAQVPVIGAIFNKLVDDDSFYSLENCREQVMQYFHQHPNEPKVDHLSTLPDVEDYRRLFASHVDVHRLLTAARQVKEATGGLLQPIATLSTTALPPSLINNNGGTGTTIPFQNPPKRRRVGEQVAARRSREEIEKAAILQGARRSA
jgi:hypothetical protein